MVLCKGRKHLQALFGEHLGTQAVQHCNWVVLSHSRFLAWREWIPVALVKLVGIGKSLNISCNLLNPSYLAFLAILLCIPAALFIPVSPALCTWCTDSKGGFDKPSSYAKQFRSESKMGSFPKVSELIFKVFFGNAQAISSVGNGEHRGKTT